MSRVVNSRLLLAQLGREVSLKLFIEAVIRNARFPYKPTDKNGFESGFHRTARLLCPSKRCVVDLSCFMQPTKQLNEVRVMCDIPTTFQLFSATAATPASRYSDYVTPFTRQGFSGLPTKSVQLAPWIVRMVDVSQSHYGYRHETYRDFAKPADAIAILKRIFFSAKFSEFWNEKYHVSIFFIDLLGTWLLAAKCSQPYHCLLICLTPTNAHTQFNRGAYPTQLAWFQRRQKSKFISDLVFVWISAV